jgi:hypothetical protein
LANRFRRDRGGAAQRIGAEVRSDGKGSYPVNVAALDRLNAMCGPGESYSNVIPRLANETPSQ